MNLLNLAWRAKRHVMTAGWQRQCPCCGRHVREFLPAGGKPNQRCPRCNSRIRHRCLWLYLEQQTNLFTSPQRVLHVAPEAALQKRLKTVAGSAYVGLDLFRDDVDCRADLCRLPFADNTFDVILAIHVLEHIPEDRLAMQELRRVLSPEGWAILQVPMDPSLAETFEDATITSPEDRERVFGQDDHVRIYGADYADRLQSTGFDLTIDHFISGLAPLTHARHGLREEPLYRVTKGA